jgi:potassium-transporting ATPase KdpC subunit
MKTNILPGIILTVCCIVIFCGVYTSVVWGIAQFAPNRGEGMLIRYRTLTGSEKYGYVNIGQSFTSDKYFRSRPSAVNYNAAASGGSNKGPSNPDYLKQVNATIDTFLMHNPEVKRSDIPADIITASGSGLDPDISPKAAIIQVARISQFRNIPKERLIILVNNYIEKPFMGMFGPERVNVLKLNVALDKIK